ncbi:LysR family transcriptional regulator [Primorskyibacter aestuariivivens]|uniref:LysR family transcriptional regulator n=1 Tax=Primorskyibacter aestuariivivens TaxID=1888912 RepID=UPI002300F4C7|nr:LysR family transcriptional regulator [Primorskyibacter aestuariivivens]MDA7427462.1 LysR family transcriptional regulator [Primorskyibacter aestuariivivens]
MRNLDVTVLRSFVAVAQCGGVTRAAGFLNLTQSAVSMQLKRLEELMGLELFDRTARRIALTGAGEQLLSYARRMVELNDEAFARLTHAEFAGEIRLGVPHDIVYPVIPLVLQRFAATMPRMRVHLVTSYTTKLREDFTRGDMDLILTTERELGAGGETLSEIALRWVGAPGGQVWRQRPLRLAQATQCGFRQGVHERLTEAGIDWIEVVETESDRTVEATVSADLAVTALLEGTAPGQLEELPAGCGLPDLGGYLVNMYRNKRSGQDPVESLAEMVRQGYETL